MNEASPERQVPPENAFDKLARLRYELANLQVIGGADNKEIAVITDQINRTVAALVRSGELDQRIAKMLGEGPNPYLNLEDESVPELNVEPDFPDLDQR